MDLQIIHLEALRAFHFGQRGVGVEASTDFAPSDTLFSALCSALRMIDSTDALTEMLARFNAGDPPFLISGGFPYILLQGTPIRFYPAPISWQIADGDSPPQRRRRKAKWISESIFRRLIEGNNALDEILIDVCQALVSASEERSLLQEYADLGRRFDGQLPLWTVDQVTRVAIDRITSASNVYRAGSLTFVSGGGIWVGILPLDKEWCQRIIPVLFEVLGEQGIGGERSSGYGAYRIRADFEAQYSLPNLHTGDRFITLSYYSPRIDTGEERVFSADCAYGLDVRRGWMGSPDNSRFRRRAVRMITAGSELRAVDGVRFYGQLVDVTPDDFSTHPVWRYGFALPVYMNE